MLQPKKVKHRKQHKGRNRGKAQRGNVISFGDYGLAEAKTTYGVIGVKCWVFKGDMTDRELRKGALSQRVSDDQPR